VVEEVGGRLRLDIRPADAQIFVDGEYVGTAPDHAGELALSAGTRRIEFRAPRHEPLAIDVRIREGETITYRGSLVSSPPPQAAAARPDAKSAAPARESTPAAAPAMFYLIPGCYLGNVPPELVKLPPGCDHSRLITHQPKHE
jgi:hypothetical protein